MVLQYTSSKQIFIFWGAGGQIVNSIVERTQNTTNPTETTQPGLKSRNNAHLRSILSSND